MREHRSNAGNGTRQEWREVGGAGPDGHWTTCLGVHMVVKGTPVAGTGGVFKGWEKPNTTEILAESQQLVHRLFNIHGIN